MKPILLSEIVKKYFMIGSKKTMQLQLSLHFFYRIKTYSIILKGIVQIRRVSA